MKKRDVDVLAPRTSECDLIWEEVLTELIKLKWGHCNGFYSSKTGVIVNKNEKFKHRDRLAQRKDDLKRQRKRKWIRLELRHHQPDNSRDSRIWKAVGRVIPLGFQREHGPAGLFVLDISSPELGDNNFSPLRKSGSFSLFHCHCQLLRESFPG